MSYSTK
ncbi:8550002a-55c6-454b-a287-ed236f4fa1bf [Thermothielavioides terrestris]|nr:8550002a-55c6-454b-a287-ed236f4fa1bf [Thermothielavioides terrestris]